VNEGKTRRRHTRSLEVLTDLRLPTGSPTTSATRLLPPPSSPLPPLSSSGPQSGTESTGRSLARRAYRSVDAAPVAPPASVGRNVDAAAAAAYALCSNKL